MSYIFLSNSVPKLLVQLLWLLNCSFNGKRKRWMKEMLVLLQSGPKGPKMTEWGTFLPFFVFRSSSSYYYCLINHSKYVFQRPWAVPVRCQFVCGWWWCWHREIPKGRFWCSWRDGNNCFLMFLLGHHQHISLFGFAFVSKATPRVKLEIAVILFCICYSNNNDIMICWLLNLAHFKLRYLQRNLWLLH